MYRSLDANKIIATCKTLRQRIGERFPSSGLFRVAEEVLAVASEAQARAELIRRPHVPLRIAIAALLFILVALPGYFVVTFVRIKLDPELLEIGNLLQWLEAATAMMIFAAGVLAFLITIESRMKRGRALAALHELRSLAHIIDMHQLAKAPERLLRGGERTPSSPERRMTAFELCRYFDYCIELLSILSKVAALYVQDFPDADTLQAVEQVEDLSAMLSRQIWQKMMAIEMVQEPGDANPPTQQQIE